MKQMTRMAKDRRPGAMGSAEAMLIEYNGRKKNLTGKLLLGKLRARDLAQLDSAEEGRENISEAAGEGQKTVKTVESLRCNGSTVFLLFLKTVVK